MDTNVEEILGLENSKLYMVLAEPMVECLTTAIRHKKLKPLSVCIWITIKSQVHLRSPEDWSTQKSIRELQAEFGVSKANIVSCLKELEEQGFIQRTTQRIDSGSNTTSTIKVCFPKAAIEVCKTHRDRAKNQESMEKSRGLNTLSTKVGQNLDHPWSKNQPVLKNTNNKKLENNKHTELSTNATSPEHEHVDCCLAAPIEKKATKDCFGDNFEQDPLVEKITAIEDKIQHLQTIEAELTVKRQADIRDTEAFQAWQKASSALDSLELQLEALKKTSQNKKIKQPPFVLAKPAEKGAKRAEPIMIPKRVSRKIELTLQDFAAKKLVSDVKTLESQVKYQVANFEMGESVEHAANICLKLIKNNTFKAPGGYRAEQINA